MSAHPIFERLFADMAKVGLVPQHDDLRQIPVNDETAPTAEEVARVQHALDLRKARIERARRESERRHAERHAEPGDAA